MRADIERLRFWIVKDGNYILVGEKSNLRFVHFKNITSRHKIVMYESEKKAKAAMEHSWYMDRLQDGSIEIVPFKETLNEWWL